MSTARFFMRYRLLSQTNAQLAVAGCLEDGLEILRRNARAITEADGVAIVRRDGDRVRYVGEDAIAPLWTGQSFPIRNCISGLAILANSPIFVPDIMQDSRVPLSAYLSTFVQSMAMYPLGSPHPVAALGLYWREARTMTSGELTLMQFLVQGANSAFEALALRAADRKAA